MLYIQLSKQEKEQTLKSALSFLAKYRKFQFSVTDGVLFIYCVRPPRFWLEPLKNAPSRVRFRVN